MFRQVPDVAAHSLDHLRKERLIPSPLASWDATHPALAVFGDIVRERGDVEVRCEFCNRAYSFDSVDAARLFAAGSPAGPAPGVH